jgi:hypothetical protein
MLPSSQKLTLGLQVTITLKVVPCRAYAPFPVLLAFSKCILELIFCEGVQNRLRLGLDHLGCVKMVGLSVLSSTGETDKSKVGGR